MYKFVPYNSLSLAVIVCDSWQLSARRIIFTQYLSSLHKITVAGISSIDTLQESRKNKVSFFF